MKKFIVIYKAPGSFMEDMKTKTKEEMKKGEKDWMQWMDKIGKGLVDMGAPLGNGQNVTKSGNSPSKSQIVGYSILQANNMGQAKKMLDMHPHLNWKSGCKIEVFEAMKMGS